LSNQIAVDLVPAVPGDRRPHVVIVGAGFGGLACAQALGGYPIRITVIDRHNYHLFVPLLYQVATAALSPADVAEPIRKILRRHDNIRVFMGEVSGVDVAGKRVLVEGEGFVAYDRLVLATGPKYNYFGNEHWAACSGPENRVGCPANPRQRAAGLRAGRIQQGSRRASCPDDLCHRRRRANRRGNGGRNRGACPLEPAARLSQYRSPLGACYSG
jgi:NADPH-dependent 2,4-dienoyl-CoA reductase/sulfur reductase-like enzyme